MRIDKLTPNSKITLNFYAGSSVAFTEDVTFLRIEGEGAEREAVFHSVPAGKPADAYTWRAYRFQGRWAYGTSADRLSLATEAKK